MLDPKKLEQACRDALAWFEADDVTEDGISKKLREALRDPDIWSEDEARNHRMVLAHAIHMATCECSCGMKFSRLVREDRWDDADFEARREWLQHLEEMSIRGLLS